MIEDTGRCVGTPRRALRSCVDVETQGKVEDMYAYLGRLFLQAFQNLVKVLIPILERS